MHSITGVNNDLKLSLPERIAELSPAQYIAFAELNFLYAVGQISFRQMKVELLYKLLNMDRKADVSKEKNELVIENVQRMAQLLDSFYTSEVQNGASVQVIDLSYVENPLSEIKMQGIMLHGPKVALTSCTFGQYMAANDTFNDFHASKDLELLDLLAAQLYWPKGQKYNGELVENRLKAFKTVDIGIKYGIFLFFAACQQFIANQNALPIGGGNYVDLTVLFKKTEDGNGKPSIGMLGSLYSLAETGVFGDIKATSDQNLYDILIYLVDKHHEVEKLKRDAKNRPA